MSDSKEHLQAISEIHSMMERSSRFISLSGLSGVFAGIFALIGAYLGHEEIESLYVYGRTGTPNYPNVILHLFIIAAAILIASISVGVFLTIRNSKKKEIKIWDTTSKRLLINLVTPLITGGFFCLALVYNGDIGMVAPATLIFYGLSLINASKYTLDDIRYLGFCEVVLGLAASLYIGYGLYFWAIGFGILHIIYGAVMYYKYERN